MAQTDAFELADQLLEVSGALLRTARRGGGLRTELTVAQMELLRLVRRRPGIPVSDAAAELLLARNTVSTLIGQLTARRLVRRVADQADRRVSRLRLTAQAEQRISAWRANRLAVAAAAIAELSPPEAAALAAALPALRRLTVPLAQSPENAA